MWASSGPIPCLDGHPRPSSLSFQASWVLPDTKQPRLESPHPGCPSIPRRPSPFPPLLWPASCFFFLFVPPLPLLFLVSFFWPLLRPTF